MFKKMAEIPIQFNYMFKKDSSFFDRHESERK